MKKTMTLGAMAVALLTAVSCSETETEITPTPGNDDQVALGITPNLKVDAGTKAATKSVVSGDAIAYDLAKYSDADCAPGLGILVTNNDATGWYIPDGTEYTGHHVWYMGDEKGTGWISIKTKAGSFKDTKEVPYYLTKTVGKVYAYYPYDVAITNSPGSITQESDLKIPVTILTAGTIDASTNNAKKYWNTSKWDNGLKANQVNLSLSTEKDYLYFAGTEGRFVNNGRATGQTPVTPDADPDNTNTVNPGYKINLDMKHAMAMVSFRVYDGGRLSENNVNFTKLEIKNADGGSNPFLVGNGTMSLVDGTIGGSLSAGALTRTITNYILMRQVDDSGTEGEYAFKSTGTSTSSINGKSVSKTVSAIVYPTDFSDGDINAIITLKEGSNADVEYPVVLPANQWEANNNYIYTLSAGRNKLTVMDVTVEAWSDNEQDEIPL